MIEAWLEQHVVAPLANSGIGVQEDARALLLLACQNQLRTRSVSSAEQLVELLGGVTPDLVSAYRFKYGDAPMTFGRAVRLLGDMAERWKDVRSGRPQTA